MTISPSPEPPGPEPPIPEAPGPVAAAGGTLAMLGVLVTAMPGHTVLHLGTTADARVAGAVLDAMDITSKLLVVTPDAASADALRSLLPGDLRLSVHGQALGSFLEDIARHRFGLVLIDGIRAAGVVAGATALVAPGGMAVGLGDTPAPAGEGLVKWLPGAGEAAWMVARQARPAARRRGGRDGRQRRQEQLSEGDTP